MIAGADGCKKGWVVVSESDDGRASIDVVPRFEDLSRRSGIELLVMDVPIGLVDEGRRRCDVEARTVIGPRRSSVFPAPIRPMLDAASFEEASRIREAIDGKRCSRQTFGILPRIRSVDELMTPALQRRVREGHPEVSFTAMNGAPMPRYKGTPEGRSLRFRALAPSFPGLRERIEELGSLKGCSVTDILDAYALLWTARRVAAGAARVIPEEPELDGRGLRMQIIA